jgi:hypothetical protein
LAKTLDFWHLQTIVKISFSDSGCVVQYLS